MAEEAGGEHASHRSRHRCGGECHACPVVHAAEPHVGGGAGEGVAADHGERDGGDCGGLLARAEQQQRGHQDKASARADQRAVGTDRNIQDQEECEFCDRRPSPFRSLPIVPLAASTGQVSLLCPRGPPLGQPVGVAARPPHRAARPACEWLRRVYAIRLPHRVDARRLPVSGPVRQVRCHSRCSVLVPPVADRMRRRDIRSGARPCFRHPTALALLQGSACAAGSADPSRSSPP